MKILFDLFPILLFFGTYKLAVFYPDQAINLTAGVGYSADPRQLPILIATAVAIMATFMQIGWLWFHHGKVDTMLWVSLALIVVFGGATLWLHDPTFIKWKPTILYWLFAAVLLIAEFGFKKNLIGAMMKGQIKLPARVWRRLNMSWIAFFAALGALNLYVAYAYSEAAWVNFKLFGFLGLMLVFIVLQGLMLAKYIEEGEAT